MDAAEVSRKPLVGNKFGGSSFRSWKFEVKHYLIYSDLYGVVTGEDLQPPMPAADVVGDARKAALEARSKWRKREQQARSLLVLNMAEN